MAKAPRKKVSVPGRESADKYYRSGEASVFGSQRPMGDGVRRSGEFPSPIPTPRQNPDDRGADKYYAQGGSDRKKLSAALTAATSPKIVKKDGVLAEVAGTKVVTITTKEQVPLAIASLLGEQASIVIVPHGDRALLTRMRSAWDQQMTLEKITEVRYVEVSIKYGPKPEAAPATVPPAPAPVDVLPPEPTPISGDQFASMLVEASNVEDQQGTVIVPPEPPTEPSQPWQAMAEDAPVEPQGHADPVGEPGEPGEPGVPDEPEAAAEPEAEAAPADDDDSDPDDDSDEEESEGE